MARASVESPSTDYYLQNKVVVLVQALLALVSIWSGGTFSLTSLIPISALGLIFIALYQAQNSPVSPFLVKLSWLLLWFSSIVFIVQTGAITGQVFLLFGLGYSVFAKPHMWIFFGFTCVASLLSSLSLGEVQSLVILGLFSALCQGVRDAMERSRQALSVAQHQDPVSGCLTGSALELEMGRAILLCGRYGTPCTAIAIEFRASEICNMQIEGRAILTLVDVWRSRLRQTDLLFRLSDTRFVCLLPSTSREQAQVLVQDLEKACSAYELPVELKFDLKFVSVDCSEQETQTIWLERIIQGLNC